MAPKQTKTTAPEEAEKNPAPRKMAQTRKEEVVLRRDAVIDNKEFKVGESIGSVELPPGIDLNYLVDAVRGGLAGPKKD